MEAILNKKFLFLVLIKLHTPLLPPTRQTFTRIVYEAETSSTSKPVNKSLLNILAL